MKSFRSVIGFAVLACAAFVASSLASVHAFALATYKAVQGFVYEGFKLFAAPDVAHDRPTIAVVRSKAFVQRLNKRERPVLFSSWRMCPSI